MSSQLRGMSILLIAATMIVLAACVMSYWSMTTAMEHLADSQADLTEARALSDEINELTASQKKFGIGILPKEQLEESLRSIVQRIQPLPTTVVSIIFGNERKASPKEFVMRQSEVQATSLTLREISEVLKSARESCPAAEVAELSMSIEAGPKQTEAERWTLGFRLLEFRYSPTEKSR